MLLNWKQDLVEEADEEGWTPLHHAAKKGNVEAVSQILQAKKTAAYRRAGCRQDDNGWTTVVHIAASHGHSKVLKEIFSHCPDCSEMVNSKSQNFLHVTILNNESRTLKFGLADPDFQHLIDEKDLDGNTPLHLLAASRCHPRNLISHPRANKRTYNNENMTPLDIVYTDKYRLDRVYIDMLIIYSSIALYMVSVLTEWKMAGALHQISSEKSWVSGKSSGG